MAKADLSSSSKPHVHTPVALRQPLCCGFSIVLCSCLFFGAAQCRARGPQDVAEAARQERARKEQTRKSKHVYTDEDLRRAKILTPEDEARVEAKRKEGIAPLDQPAEAPLDASSDLPQLPLGDIARRYRSAKLAAQQSLQFHLPFDEPIFASPTISLPKLAPPAPSFSPTHPNLAPAHPDAAVAPAIANPAPSGHLDPSISLPKLAPPLPSFSPTHPKLAAAHRAAVAAPAISSPAPLGHLDPSVALPKVTPPLPSFTPVHPNLVPGRPNTIVAPTIPNPGSLRRLDPFARRTASAAPPSISRITPSVPHVPRPKIHTAIAPPVSRADVAPAIGPAIAQPKAPTAIASPSTFAKTSSLHTVIMQRGDSLWKLAQENLGRGSRWQELLAANPGIVDPTRIVVGTEIVVPAKTVGLKSDLRVTVQQGDTLSRIAQSNYGLGAAWRCIAEANPEIADANRIYEGQQLLLPARCKP